MLKLFLARVCCIFSSRGQSGIGSVELKSLRHAPRRHRLKSRPKQKLLENDHMKGGSECHFEDQ